MEGFVLGNLYPKNRDGEPNLVLSSSYELDTNDDGHFVVTRKQGNNKNEGVLETNLSVNTDSVQINNISGFVNNWLIPQLDIEEKNRSAYQYRATVSGNFADQTLNRTLESLKNIGYRGYGWDKANTNEAPWNEDGKKDDNYTSSEAEKLDKQILKNKNYQSSSIWENYSNTDDVNSVFDVETLKANLDKGQDSADLWYPRFLYTYKIDGQETTYPGPVLMLPPGDTLKINFANDIQIPGLTPEEMQAASLIGNDSYGLNGGAMEGGMTSTNFHMHGGHVNATGFGDNVVSRFTTGQSWTTEIPIPEDHGQGSYWYHPHYHPAVNTQLYGGLSGFMQVGDPLAKVPGLQATPRNLAVLKTMDVGVNEQSGDLELAAIDTVSVQGQPVNRMTLFTINGEFQPSENIKPGWQSLTLSNQDNNYYFNIKLVQINDDGTRSDVPLYMYGEDGHQYPQIRRAEQTIIGYDQPYETNEITPFTSTNNKPAKGYAKADDIIAMSSGKRADVLFYAQPDTTIEIESVYNFENKEDGKEYQINNLRFQASQYQNLSSSNIGQDESNSGQGPLGKFVVDASGESLTNKQQDTFIKKANNDTKVQVVEPTTKAEDYDTEAIPSVDLFEQTEKGEDKWLPVRKREMNYSVLMLVGPKRQWDAANVEEAKKKKEKGFGTAEQYKFLPDFGEWLGYENPDFINDHVFPNGNLNIAQLGTMEEWRLRNWNWGFPGFNSYFVGHPFHIHVNDYQVKDSDTGLSNKKNLEDVTMLNGSGYHYYNATEKKVVKKKPYSGEFHKIKPAQHESTVSELATTGANDTTIRMLFQDYIGTYVHHCHLLEHEDAGMMQVVTIVENTADSWLVPAEDESLKDGNFTIYRAQDYASFEHTINLSTNESIERASAGDLTGDFVQDILLASQDASATGQVLILDGNEASNGKTTVAGQFSPYQNSQLAPWLNAEDFTGDGNRDLITAGFTEASIDSNLDLKKMRITAWQNDSQDLSQWDSIQEINPWENLTIKNEFAPVKNLEQTQVSFTVGDFNLDNFNDYAIAYALNDGGLRVSILDGSVFSLQYQTGKKEGGYFGKYPIGNDDILADVILNDVSTEEISQVVLTAGFNSYAQSPIENLLVTTQNDSGSYLHTLQLAAGHFIAHSIPEDDEALESLSPISEHDSHMDHDHEGHEGHEGHGHGNEIAAEADDGSYRNTGKGAMNIAPSAATPSPQILSDGIESVAPVISGAMGQGAVVAGSQLIIEQGNGTIGKMSNSDVITNSSAQLAINLDELNIVNKNDLQGITDSDMDSTFGAEDYYARNNLTALAKQVYTNQMIWPSSLSALSAKVLGTGKTVEDLADKINNKYSDSISAYYGDELNEIDADTIIGKAFMTLYQRQPEADELAKWNEKVADNTVNKSHLPMEILLDTQGSDQYRVGLLSAGSQWVTSQYMIAASIKGSFSQGFQKDEERFSVIKEDLYDRPTSKLNNWKSTQSVFEDFTSTGLTTLVGTPVSDTGFF